MHTTMKNTRISKKFTLKKKKWMYRGEGNANLVLALPQDHLILRLRKSCPSEGSNEEEERIWRELEFCRGVMLPLLGERFVHVPTVVRLEEAELRELNEALRSCRPKHRHHKGVYFDHAALFPDLCLLPATPSTLRWTPTFCVEVKPKQGWIPPADRRLSKCTFCLNQYLKLRHGTVTQQTGYCPLDLFSGNRLRMKKAIKSLLLCPQNNLKMFKNGHIVFGDSSLQLFEAILEDWFGLRGIDALVDNFTSLVVDALLSDTKSGALLKELPAGAASLETARIPRQLLEEAQALIPGPSCYRDSEPLPPGCILSRILRVQQLDQCGSDLVHQLYTSGATKSSDHAYVGDLLRAPRNLLKPINAYLVATTAKDCSVLMSFQKTDDTSQPTVRDLNNTPYVFNIGVSDLDPKPMSCIEKHRVRDYEVVVHCIDVLRGSARASQFVGR